MRMEIMQRIKILRDKLNNDDLTQEDIRTYCIQLETMLPEPTKKLYIDADGLIFYAAYSPINKTNVTPMLEGSFVGDKVDNMELITSFNDIVAGVVEACRLESLKGNMVRFKDYVLVFTPSHNFRYDLYSDYKANRAGREKSKEEVFIKNYINENNIGITHDDVEADDVVAYYARRGNPIASGDKDVIFGVEGNNYFYHSAHKKVYKRTKEDAEKFVLCQTLAGDSGDNISGIKGVGLKLTNGEWTGKAVELFDDKPVTFNTVVEHYISKGYKLEDSILARRLVGLDQWCGPRRNKIKLFDYKG